MAMPITPGTHVPAYATKPADGACYLIKKVFAQSQTTGGFEFGKFYTLLARPGKLSDCIIRVKTAYAKDEIEFKCVAFAPRKKVPLERMK
jgi:hypothetical protein